MKKIGHMRGREDFGIFEPEADDRLFVEGGRGSALRVISEGKYLCSTDKLFYPSLGGVTLCGGIENPPPPRGRWILRSLAVFVINPRWVAANIASVLRLEDGENGPIELSPISDIDEAVRIIRRERPDYQWMREYDAWGVPGYEFGPENWLLF